MNLPTLLILAVIALITYFCVKSLRSSRENCGGCYASSYCNHTAKSCTFTKDIEQAKRDLAKERADKQNLA